MKTAAEILRDAEAAIRAVIEQIRPLGQHGNRATVGVAIRRMLEARAEGATHLLDYTTQWSQDDVLRILPRNVFTGLLLAGKHVSEAVRFAGVQEARFDEGTYLINAHGFFVFVPSAPAESLTLTFAFPEAPHA